jgi:acyl transferase domain-containing protein/acyl carrier protein/ribosomal protein S18 acetylase RimI-like enzyme/protein-L-isoaspartate O-methyltransferase
MTPAEPTDAFAVLLACAKSGLFLQPGADWQQLARQPLTEIVEQLEQQPYLIRPARFDDLDRLVELEDACWPEKLRSSRQDIRQRIETLPEGQLLLELEGRVCGAIYSQRIDDVDLLDGHTSGTVAGLHSPTGRVAQLLAVNVFPEQQHLGLGDRLLEHVLQLYCTKPGIEKIAAVSLCRSYPHHRSQSFASYIHQRDVNGLIVDPILRFHQAHGARIRRPVANYRPDDADNLGNGVLVEYGLDRQPLVMAPIRTGSTASTGRDPADVRSTVARCITALLDDEQILSWQVPLMDMGLDSLNLMSLRAQLNRHFGEELQSSFFFRYPTAEAIAGYLAGDHTDIAPDTGQLASPRPIGRGNGQQPVAIIGAACRLPQGISGPDDLWSLLRAGKHAIGEVPASRWDIDRYYDPEPGKDGAIISRFGGFVDEFDRFDASFFGISPREADATDPQQRLLLEVTWEAFERAAIDPSSLAGSCTGVFAGVFSHDYELLQVKQKRTEAYDTYYATGSSAAVSAGRLAYVLGLQGPAIAVDTACSSSLVAVHLACQSLLAGECRVALAAGVNLLLTPELSIAFSKAGMLSPDGLCKTFDAAADGYVRSEGCAAVVLKPLAQALEDGDNVLAVIRATAINQDGASNGLTAPNGLAQEAVMAQALATAGLAPEQISYVEAHGTGTALGDPVEFASIAKVYGGRRSTESPLVLGSVKTNIGHTEATAGLAGLLKVVVALQNRYIPPHLHFQQANPAIDLDSVPVTIPVTGQEWLTTGTETTRRAAVSSFGFSGTNAHAIIEEAPAPRVRTATGTRRPHLLTLSAKSEPALRQLAERYVAHLTAHPEERLADFCHTINTGRACHNLRLALVADTAAELIEQLQAFQDAGEGTGLLTGVCKAPPRIALAFPAAGKQPQVGPELLEHQPVFRDAVQRCDALLKERHGLSLLTNGRLEPDLSDSSELGLFAVENGLLELWRSWGVTPAAVTGQGIGECVAAMAAGVLTLEDGLALAVARSRRLPAKELHAVTNDLGYSAPVCDLYSTAGKLSADQVTSADYWAAEREPGAWMAVVDSHDLHLVVGPDLGDDDLPGLWLPSLSHGPSSWHKLLQALAQLYVHGADICWHEVDRGQACRRVVVPTYPFERRRHWLRPATTDSRDSQESPRQTNDDHLYQLIWHEAVRPSGPGTARYLTAPSEVEARLHRSELAGDAAVSCPGLAQRLERLSLAYVVEAFSQLGWDLTPGERLTTTTLAERLGIISSQHRFMEHLLGMLWKEGIINRTGQELEVVSIADLPSSGKQLQELVDRYPAADAELEMLGRCGAELAGVLTGRIDPLGLLFPEADLSTATRLYQESPTFGPMNQILQDAVAAAVAGLPAGTGLRVIEIGAGTGGTTARLLAELASRTSEYLFTDVSSLFLGTARKRFSDYPFMSYQLLDIESDPDQQGLAGEQYDIVIAANVLHATRDLRDTLANVRKLLAPNGALILLEGVAHRRWIDLIFGMLEGWWRFTDHDLRPAQPLLPVATWHQLLAEAGFGESAAVTPDWDECLFDQAVLLARTPAAPETEASTRHWMIFADAGGLGHQLAAQLSARGDRCTLVNAGESFSSADTDSFQVNPLCRQDFDELLEAVGPRLHGCVHLWSLDAEPGADLTTDGLNAASAKGCASTLHLVQALTAGQPERLPALWLVTMGAVAATDGDLPGLAQSPIWGLGQVCTQEHPDLVCSRVDLDPAAESDKLQTLLAELTGTEGAQQTVFRGRHRYQPALARLDLPAVDSPSLSADATYVIAGGLGGLGLELARWMAELGARHLVLVGRSGPPESESTAAAAVRRLEEHGVEVRVAQADISRADELAAVLDEVDQTMPELRGLVHAAGVFDDRLLAAHQWQLFDKVFAPKVTGAWNLHQLTLDRRLDLFLLCSSATSMICSFGLANYVAANQFLDALASHRRGLGLPGLSISWGPWTDVGMASAVGSRRQAQWSAEGLATIEPEQALAALGGLLPSRLATAAVMSVDWQRYFARHPEDGAASLLAGRAPAAESDHAGAQQILDRLRSAPSKRRLQLIHDQVCSLVATVLGRDPGDPIDPEQGFFDMGMDSLTATDLRNRLQQAFACSLPPTLTFKYPSVQALAAHLVARLDADGSSPSTDSDEAIAVATKARIDLPELARLTEHEADQLLLEQLERLGY